MQFKRQFTCFPKVCRHLRFCLVFGLSNSPFFASFSSGALNIYRGRRTRQFECFSVVSERATAFLAMNKEFEKLVHL